MAVLLGLCLIVGIPQPAGAQLNLDNRPYDDKLLRLSEILGAIHYLRELCGAHEGQVWRDQMKKLIDSEGTTAIRRAKLVKGFNKGYRGYRRTYRSCTEPAKLAVDRFMEEGVALSEVLLKENQ
ncbi:MAG: TIGR02301 family protein [Methyloligellaceae bacterium]